MLLMALPHQGSAQNSAVETNSPVVRLVGGTGGSAAPGSEKITHELVVQRGGGFPRVLRVDNGGKVEIGRDLSQDVSGGIRSMFNVGQRINTLSVDELGSARLNNAGVSVAGVTGGGACVGFNATRQTDSDIACEANNAGTRNGGALIWAQDEGALNFTAFPTNHGNVGGGNGTQWYHPTDANYFRVMKIWPVAIGQTPQSLCGRVQIGTYAPPLGTTHGDYRLAVDGKLVARSIFVTQAANWADFVFAPTYALQPLPELETYLKQNRHLPAIPSAAEVAKNGIDLGEMNARLLQSLEELTLHVIELGKQNARLQAEVAALAVRVNQTATPAASK